jgi:hypothetical protein
MATSSDGHQKCFSYGDLKEDIYTTPPLGLFSSPFAIVFKLKRSLYGLKQAPRAWFKNASLLCFASPLTKANMTPFCSFARIQLVLFLYLFMWMILSFVVPNTI